MYFPQNVKYTGRIFTLEWNNPPAGAPTKLFVSNETAKWEPEHKDSYPIACFFEGDSTYPGEWVWQYDAKKRLPQGPGEQGSGKIPPGQGPQPVKGAPK